MTLSSLFERIAGKQNERQQTREANLRSLVAQIADGQDPDPDFVDRILTENRQTVDDLRQAVELLQHRRQLRQTWDKAAKMEKDRDRIKQQITEANQLLEQAEIKHEETTAPLYAQIEAIKQAGIAADRARSELWDTCSYPELCDELDRVTKRLETLYTQRANKEREAADLRQWAESDHHETQFVAHKSEEDELRQRADRRDAKAKPLEDEVTKLQKQIEQLDKEDARLRNQMLVP